MKLRSGKYAKLFTTAILLLGTAIASSFIDKGHEKKIINITGTRFFYPLVEKWAEEFKKENPDVDIIVRFGLQNADISMTGTPVDKENPDKGKYTVVSKFAVVPIINEQNPAWTELQKRGLSKTDFEKIYFRGELTNEFTLFKNFDVQASLNYSIGNDIWNNTRYRMGHGGSRNGVFAMLTEELNRWQKPGDKTDIPRLTASGNNAAIIPSRFLEDGSFVRLRNLAVGYSLPKSLLTRLNISALRVYFSATNLFTITKYKGIDPEVNVSNGDQNVLGYDQAIAPQPRTFQAGFNLSF